MFLLHTVFILLGPILGLLIRLSFGNWHLSNNLGFTSHGSSKFYKAFQMMYQMIFLMGNLVWFNALYERKWNLVCTHREGFDVVLLASTWL